MKKPTILMLALLMCCLVLFVSCDETNRTLQTTNPQITEQPAPCVNGHTEVIDAAIAPTCTKNGKTAGKHCSVCGEVLVAQKEVDALGHTETIDAAIAPTCTEKGKTEGKHCSVCNEVLVAQTNVDALGHNEIIDAPAVPPSCTEKGKTESKHCSICNEILTSQIELDALGHTEIIDFAITPTCTAAGKTGGKHCSVCKEILIPQTELNALGHTEAIDAAIAPTCTKNGKTAGKHCSVCSEVLVAQKDVDALGHTETIDAAIAPTCTEKGKTEGSHCSVCSAILIVQIDLEAIGHNTVIDIAVAPSSFTTGLTEGSHCSSCKDTIVEQKEIPALSAPIADLSAIPDYTDSPFFVLNNNTPYFTAKQYASCSYEYYSLLDALGRCSVAMTCIGIDLMPTDEYGDISSVTPTGWQSVQYDIVPGGYLYNRCHIIGFQLSGENANRQNLITGTRYFNVSGMLPFENMIADYVKETQNHVLFRVSPIFVGDELVARGVQMEAYSVEDNGAGICFNVFVYNVQPGIIIDYATGNNQKADDDSTSEEDSSGKDYNYILNISTKKFHYPSCSSVKNMNEENKSFFNGTRDEAISAGYSPCGRCDP